MTEGLHGERRWTGIGSLRFVDHLASGLEPRNAQPERQGVPSSTGHLPSVDAPGVKAATPRRTAWWAVVAAVLVLASGVNLVVWRGLPLLGWVLIMLAAGRLIYVAATPNRR